MVNKSCDLTTRDNSTCGDLSACNISENVLAFWLQH